MTATIVGRTPLVAGGSTSLGTNTPWVGTDVGAVGDVRLLIVANNPSSVNPSPDSGGWALLGQVGGGASGLEKKTTVWWKRVAVAGAIGQEVVTATGGTEGYVAQYLIRPSQPFETVNDPVMGTATDTGHDTSVSFAATMPSQTEQGALFVVAVGSQANGTPGTPTFSQTGATFGTASITDHSVMSPATGCSVWSGYCTSGPSSSTTFTAASTASGNFSGSAVVVRLTTSATMSDGESLGAADASTMAANFATVDEMLTFGGETSALTDTTREITVAETLSFMEGDDSVRAMDDNDTLSVADDAVAVVSEFTVVFNDSVNYPGYDIQLSGVTDDADYITVIRRDPLGLYPDTPVRGMDRVIPPGGVLSGRDIEAPLGVVLDYYLELHQTAGGKFIVGPVRPAQSYIPTMTNAQGGGLAFLKHLTAWPLSRAVIVNTFAGYERKMRLNAEHDVIGQEMPALITGVMGSRRGTFTLNFWLDEGQTHWDLEALLKDGSTLLLQTNNPLASGFRDAYIKVTGFKFVRYTKMSIYGLQDAGGANPGALCTVELQFIEQGRPSSVGILLATRSWQGVKDNFTSWQEVKDSRTSWLDVLLRASEGP